MISIGVSNISTSLQDRLVLWIHTMAEQLDLKELDDNEQEDNEEEDENVRIQKLLKECEMFQKMPDHRLELLAKHMEYKTLPKNHVLLQQGQFSDRFFLLESGDIRRKKVDPNTGKIHNIEYAIKASSINSMKVMAGDPVVSRQARCVRQRCRSGKMALNSCMLLQCFRFISRCILRFILQKVCHDQMHIGYVQGI